MQLYYFNFKFKTNMSTITNLIVVRSFYKGRPYMEGLANAVHFSNLDTKEYKYLCNQKEFKTIDYVYKKDTINGFKDQESEIYWYNKSKKCIDTLKEILPKYKCVAYIECLPSQDELDFFNDSNIDVTVLETHVSAKAEIDSYNNIPKNVKVIYCSVFSLISREDEENSRFLTYLHWLNLRREGFSQNFIPYEHGIVCDSTLDNVFPNEPLNEFYKDVVCNTKDVAKYLKEHTEYIFNKMKEKKVITPEEKINDAKELAKIYKVFKLNEYKVMFYETNIYEHGIFFENFSMIEAKEHNYDFIMYLIPGTTYATLRSVCVDLTTVYFFKQLKEKNLNIVGDSDFYRGDIFIEDDTFNEYVSNNLLF